MYILVYMDSLQTDVDNLESAMRLMFQTMKRPQNWSRITERSRVSIDRPAAIILKVLMSGNKDWRIQDLADLLGIEAPSVTRKTQHMQAAGLVIRKQNPLDRRAVSLSITSRGRNIAKRIADAQRAIMAEALADWPADRRHQFVVLFQRFSDDLALSSPAKSLSRKELNHV